MDPTTLLISMLIKAAAPTAQRAIADAYQVLRTALIRKYGPDLGLAVDELARHPDSEPTRQMVAHKLQASGATRDPEILALTADLNYLVDNLELPDGADRVTRAKRQAGHRAVQWVLGRHVHTVLAARDAYNLPDTRLLTANVADSTLPKEVKAELGALHATMRTLIAQIADQLEGEAYRGVETALNDDRLGMSNRTNALELIRADRAVHTSYQTLQLTVEYFREFNHSMLERIESAPTAEREGSMMLGNAVLIYELAAYVIAFIQAFAPDGSAQVEQLWQASQMRIAAIRKDHEALEQRVMAPQIPPELREQTLQDIRDRYAALDEMEREWVDYVEETRKLNGMVDDVRARIPMLEVIRDNAAAQISTLQEIALIRFLKQNTQTINRTVDTMQEFRLAPLTPSRVRRLLGV